MKGAVCDIAGEKKSPFEERSFSSPPHPHIFSQTFSQYGFADRFTIPKTGTETI